MKTLLSVLKHLHEVAHDGGEKLIEDAMCTEKSIELKDGHGLNDAQDINTSYDKNKAIHELHETDEEIIKSIEHLKSTGFFKGTKSLKELVRKCLEPYENRKIEVGNHEIDPKKIIKILEENNITTAVVSYKDMLFCPSDVEMWKKYSPREMERLIFYAFPRTRAKMALEQIAHIIGRPVLTEKGNYKRNKYTKYHFEDYKINDPDGLHARPASQVAAVANRYENLDIWIRTKSREANAKSIMSLLILEAKKDVLRVLCKPANESFYRELGSIPFRDKTLFSRINYSPVTQHKSQACRALP
jgi:phosphotransferase system HPr (HPr) family protein